ncbi:MAG: sigma-54-dependent Fis family transcriptional regulator [Deltaproteobacteria bacterium]|uniref:sigma-54-dependent transcriptional regulator n=1 Tax=Desulfobacula sp. TaxID=2593537 RepID=UPI0019838C38|nr:sigma-54-dependent Fis family transcriptional regulator [Candidatus Desulfobacula maris]MBL6993093.1 sigma-54-dependent Fis family transcriptional regulator [Desulfobacula sp.]
MAKILIIDDDEGICKVLSRMATGGGHDAVSALTIKQGLTALQSAKFDVVFLDVNLPDGSGLDMIPMIKKMPYSPEVIIITGLGEPDGAETAITLGAWDYLLKPLSIKPLTLTLKRVLQYRDACAKNSIASFDIKLEGVESSSPIMRECLKALSHAAKSDANVLLTGETGTGKDFFARALHNNSNRADNNFVLADCAALPGSLVESMLFGSDKGAYTDAKQSKIGLVEQADKGTLFLDEIGELPFVNQKAFLNVLDTHEFRPIGGRHVIKSDFRLISATNRNLPDLVEKGLFRKDLFYRLHAFSIVLPPLRQCLEDIEPLALYCMYKMCKRIKAAPKDFSSDFFEYCAGYGWPGNIRELFNTIETMILKTPDEQVLFPKHLPEHIRVKVTRTSVDKGNKQQEDKKKDKNGYTDTFLSFKDFKAATLEEAQKKYFLSLMNFTGGDIKEACRISGISRSGIYNFLKKYNITRAGWTSP